MFYIKIYPINSKEYCKCGRSVVKNSSFKLIIHPFFPKKRGLENNIEVKTMNKTPASDGL